ncbi:uncharacterized protein LOC111691336 [Anoplophora glabripennis]|uniref:uncharacterized protein LOC111691336 n=1 Tax=Anoplophora glabripennis TaxID=217634 RepID=UPI000C7807BF|nr:uncharacterized protein LOC111691336 [Anoplophora glabripennis]
MDFSSDPSEENKLDNDFRRILYVIKQYIEYINSNHQLSLYRSWLEKLSTASAEKMERNMYLFELARQIKSKKLLPPFNRHPPPGPLKNLPKINRFRPADLENSVHDNEQSNEEQTNLLHPEHTTPVKDFSEQGYSNPLQQFIDQNQRNIQLSSPLQSPYGHQDDYLQTIFTQPSECYYHPCYVEDGSETPVETVRSPTKTKKRKSKSARSLQKPSVVDNISRGVTEEYEKHAVKALINLNPQKICAEKESTVEKEPSVKDDSSWCDLSDTSQTSISMMASGDNEKSPPKVQEKVKQFNGILKMLDQPQIPYGNKGSPQNLYKKNKYSLSDEAEKISRKIQNLNEAKVSLKDTNFISSDWKKTIEGLQLRLTETLNQNNELKSIINSLQLKLKNESLKNKEQNDCNQKKTELRKREIDALQQIQADNVKKLEKTFHAKLDEAERSYQQKIEKFKTNYETKIRELHAKNDHSKKDKDFEMCRLSEVIQQHLVKSIKSSKKVVKSICCNVYGLRRVPVRQAFRSLKILQSESYVSERCSRMSKEISALRIQIENAFSNHNNDDKIIVLQKCVSKMDKLFQRSEKEYQKQIDKLKQELDLKDKVMQIQLKTQRAELIARSSVEKQKQFDEVINNLEIKYIKMLEFHESQVNQTKGQDEKRIEQLKHLLDKNNIPYDVL